MALSQSSVVSHGVCQYVLRRFTEPLRSSKASFIPTCSHGRTRVSPAPSSSLEAAVFPNWTAVALFIALRGNSVAKGKLQSTQPTSGCQPPTTLFLALCKHRFRYSVARQVSKHPFKSKLHILRPYATIPDYVVCLGHAVGRSGG